MSMSGFNQKHQMSLPEGDEENKLISIMVHKSKLFQPQIKNLLDINYCSLVWKLQRKFCIWKTAQPFKVFGL